MELGLRLALGREYRTVCSVERDAYAASVQVARMEEQALDPAPIWDDLTTFDGRPWRGVVDLVSGGIPCQPYSVAGKRKGDDDERALWPEVVRIVRETDAGMLFLEEVPGFLDVCRPLWTELRSLGFEWAPLLHATAAQYGSPQDRHRVFLLAARPERFQVWAEQGWLEPGWSGEAVHGNAGPEPAGAEGERSTEPEKSPPTGRAEGEQRSPDSGLPDACAARIRRREGWAESEGEQGRSNDQLPSGEPSRPDSQRLCGERCGWVFHQERQTLRHHPDGCGVRCAVRGSHWASESPVVRVDSRTPDWVERVRTVGNVGTPPLVYAHALRTLAARLGL